MKGIVLAGGTGSRLWPITRTVSKQLLPVYDKPLIYYPISTLMLAGVREILIITTPGDQHLYQELLKDGSQLGVSFKYEVQPEPKGLAQAFIIGEKFLDGESCLMILGDNIFHGSGLGTEIQNSISKSGAHIFTYEVKNPNDYGVLSLDRHGHPVSITEKPDVFISNLAVTGLYAFDSNVSEIAKSLVLSARGELEITSLLEKYLNSGQLTYTALSRGVAWLDTGNPKSLNDATNYIRVIEERTGLKIGCIEEIAFRSSWIDNDQLIKNARELGKNSYSEYLMSLNFDQKISNRI
jgi:glucose-1-phosphate thymidylyltransferase